MLSESLRYRNRRQGREECIVTVRLLAPDHGQITIRRRFRRAPSVGSRFDYGGTAWEIVRSDEGALVAEPAAVEARVEEPPPVPAAAPEVTTRQVIAVPRTRRQAPTEPDVEVTLFPTTQPSLVLFCWTENDQVLTGAFRRGDPEYRSAKQRVSKALGEECGHRIPLDWNGLLPRIPVARGRALDLVERCRALFDGTRVPPRSR